MIAVTFVDRSGKTVTAHGESGARLLDVAQALGLPLEGTCDGQMACSTCHVWIDEADWNRLPPASADEEALLDFADHAGPTSRLACQIGLTDALRGLTVQVPPA